MSQLTASYGLKINEIIMINNFCSTLHPCAASAATAGGAGGARAAAAGGVFPNIKAHPTDLGGATQEHIPCSNSKASSSKAMLASSQAPQGRAAASAARDYNIVTNMKSLC